MNIFRNNVYFLDGGKTLYCQKSYHSPWLKNKQTTTTETIKLCASYIGHTTYKDGDGANTAVTDTCDLEMALPLTLKCHCHYQHENSENAERVFSEV